MQFYQDFILDIEDVPEGTSSLYYKGDSPKKINNSVNFSTWFNSLNCEKWLHFTKVDSFSIQIEYSGTGTAELYSNINNCKKFVLKKTLDSEVKYLNIPLKNIDSKSGILSLVIKTDSEISITSARWVLNSKESEANNIKCAIVICTHNRQQYLERTVKTLEKYLPENWGAYIIDNESTPAVDIKISKDPRFKVVRNKNTGGSGGFTRGIIEALKSSNNWSHVLLMDDDIILDGNVLNRTDSLLKALKPQYTRHFISGGMLRLDTPTIQHESGAIWNGIRVKHLNHNLDLSKSENIIKSEKIINKKNSYAAWWYCVIPLSKELETSLPMPFFVNGDDIEYSLRHAKGIITMNGISVWHEPFHLKYNPIKQHYLTTRNGLYINTLHNYGRFRTVGMAGLRYFLQRTKGHRYEAGLVALGIAHYLQGPKVLQDEPNPFIIKEKNIYNSRIVSKMLLKILCNYRKIQNKLSIFTLKSTLWNDINI